MEMENDLNAEQIISKIYKERKTEIDANYNWEKHSTQMQQLYSECFVDCISEMGSMIPYVGWDGDKTYKYWRNILNNLVNMCVLAGKEPIYKFDFNYCGYTFREYTQNSRQMYIIHHIGHLIDAQVVRCEPLWWIELGNQAGITDIKI